MYNLQHKQILKLKVLIEKGVSDDKIRQAAIQWFRAYIPNRNFAKVKQFLIDYEITK